MTEYNQPMTIEEIVSKSNAVVILYYAKWCMPCKSISQSLDEIKINYKDSIQIIAVNVDEFPLIALEQNVRAVPTLQYYKNGFIYLKESGFRTRDQLIRNLDALLTVANLEE
jgi:thioredoxin 1